MLYYSGLLLTVPQEHYFYIPKLSLCISILKKPHYPQKVPQLFLAIQYYFKPYLPQPTIETS